MNAYYCHHFVLPLPPEHRFPMAKYARLYERVAKTAADWGITLREPAPADDTALCRAHDPSYVQRASRGELSASELRKIGFPWSEWMIERSRRSSGGTMAALQSAVVARGVGLNLAGGTHHAFADHGAGYCVFNDSVVAARHVQAQGLAQRILVVDLDVHQGNGTASIARDDPSIFTFSMHGERNYPALKECSDLDVALPDGCDDVTYLASLADALPTAIARSCAEAVIYLAGADPFEGDRLGRLALSKDGLRQRDRMVFDACVRHHLPVAVSMAGGYAADVDDIVDIHYATVAEAAAAAAAFGRSGRKDTGTGQRRA
ncbi:histone deacetylase family protein [Tahibacter amnicola]|uniref:Histone deacetylase n=1 Tax=Tahibacter amnicola TaxID=2976241 RepID=A0ABY6BD14_9GAMM|nr:histone deacetylase [Tahibacter amnicola]UXI67629.1 histone deacetylase [Tahibacter amnicola]